MIGLSKPSIHRLVNAGQFPRPLALGGGAVRWRLSELMEWVESRPRADGEGAGDA